MSLLSPRRTGSSSSTRSGSRTGEGREGAGVRLTATLTAESSEQLDTSVLVPKVGWLPMAIVGALVTALSGWVIVAGVTVLGWLAGAVGTLSAALHTGTELWLLTNGAGARLGRIGWTLTPLGISVVIAYLFSRLAAMVARQYVSEHPGTTRLRATVSVTAAMGVSYGLLVAGAAVAVGLPVQAGRGLLGGFVIAGLGAAWGAARSLDYRPSDAWPGWAQGLPRAVASAQAVILIGGTAALAVSLFVHLDRVVRLSDQLGAGIAGGIAITVAQLAFAPNLIIWSSSYALGAGFTLGQGSQVAPAATNLGLLPPFPVLGALPAEGGGSYWQLLWLLVGAVAGGVAAWQLVRRRPQARFDETSLVGGLSGVLAALVFVLLGWFSSGDLGDVRLAGVGPRELPLLVMAGTTLGLAGLITGLVIGVVRHFRR